MNKEVLLKYINAYKKQIEEHAIDVKKEMESRDERVSFYRSFTKEKIEKISYDDFTAFVNEFLVSYIFNRIKDVEKEINDCYPPNQNEELTTDEVVEVAEVVSESNE